MNDIDTASLSARISILESHTVKLEAALDECIAALTYPAKVTSKHGNVPDTLRHLADLMVDDGEKVGWALWLRRAAGVMDEALVQAQEALGTD